jgi:heme o synthase
LATLSVRGLLTLTRYRVSAAVTFSAFASSVMCRRGFSWMDILPLSGILLLAAGSSALNQYQERDLDAMMPRTMRRPLPAQEITPSSALMVAWFLIVGGLSLILAGGHTSTACLGLFNILWYNGIYTNLKKTTAFAVVPGALTGAVPILMGWTAAGGSMFDPLPMFLAFFIFLWQVPHFWLLALIYEDDYRKAGFPLLSGVFSMNVQKRIIFSWLAAASVSTIFLILFRLVTQPLIVDLIIALNVLVMIYSVYNLFIHKPEQFRMLFLVANLFMFAVFFLVVAEHL